MTLYTATPDGQRAMTLEEVTTYEASRTRMRQEAEAASWGRFLAERNHRLTECDWNMTLDAPLSIEQKSAWGAYRQELRDLPANTADPENPNWPSVP